MAKKGIHPETLRPVLFHDITAGAYLIVLSTVKTTERRVGPDGNEYDYKPVEVSSASHPAYTGEYTLIDTMGRVKRFRQKLIRKQQRPQSQPAEQ